MTPILRKDQRSQKYNCYLYMSFIIIIRRIINKIYKYFYETQFEQNFSLNFVQQLYIWGINREGLTNTYCRRNRTK